ncbi:Metallo-dependent phosphatase [Schizopora paradoxa]|uniref:Serine/threonine-protein phosphatase n=1 Tax=Schizopora paradoxa TaxID=27342 RepID=A0A0H2RS21_9AGAM|nr:Metallo-dependent phosphatase [Schizopora paradoxa]
MIQRLRFEKAIKLREEPNVIEQCYEIIDQGECTVGGDYAGPILPFVSQPDLSGTERSNFPKGRYSITLEFVTKLLKWYADGKILPRSMVEATIGEEQTASIIGDVHGQFYDYLHLLSLTGFPSENHIFLMNGDLVDRGAWSIEIIVTAFALKWLYPNRMFINRGNHETRCMNASYGFKTETVQKYDEMTYELFAHVFTALPLATMINASRPFPSSHLTGSENTIEGFAVPTPLILSPLGCKRYFVTHGGLFSRDDVTLNNIRNILRLGREPGPEGLMAEMLWTDPQDEPGRGPNDRGGGLMFGPDVSSRWCTLNRVTGIFRSHQLREDGFAVEHDGLCITVFSAPKYADKYDNKGAFIRVDSSGGLDFIQFEAQPHPAVKPIVDDD